MTLVLFAFLLWAAGYALNVVLANGPARDTQAVRLAVPLIFGATVLGMWELAVRGLEVPRVILPPPSQIAATFGTNLALLWGDFTQTILKGALAGYAIGNIAAFLTALVIDRSDYLRRGLLPLGNFMAALPIVGTAPILGNVVRLWLAVEGGGGGADGLFPDAGEHGGGALGDHDDAARPDAHLMPPAGGRHSGPCTCPPRLPFVFNGLKITSTLALIGAIVAEFFGSPTLGMGFRISTSIGQLDLAMVWSTIVVAALCGHRLLRAGCLARGTADLLACGDAWWLTSLNTRRHHQFLSIPPPYHPRI